MTQTYAKRFAQVFDYIDRHLDEALTVEKLSEVAHFSRFHFQRQFSAYCGISVWRYIQWMRLKRASYRLAYNPLEPVIDIALDAGFQNPSPSAAPSNRRSAKRQASFANGRPGSIGSSAFEPKHKKPHEGRHCRLPGHAGGDDRTSRPVRAGQAKPPRALSSGAKPAACRRSEAAVLSASHRTIRPPPKRRTSASSFAARLLRRSPDNAFGVVNNTLPAGRCALLRHHGSLDGLSEGAHYLYREWLPASGEDCAIFRSISTTTTSCTKWRNMNW